MMTTAEMTSITVGELSRRTGVSIKALRDYTDWGLIDNLGRSAGNYRLYTLDALWCVQTITELRGLGLTLAEIRQVAHAASNDRGGVGRVLADRLHTAQARLERQIAELEQTRRRLARFEAAHRAELAGETPLWPDAPVEPAA